MNDTKLIDALKETSAPPPAFTPAPQLKQLWLMIGQAIDSGQILSLAAITAGPRGEIGWPAFGMQLAELMLGAEFLRDDLKANMRGQKKILKAS